MGHEIWTGTGGWDDGVEVSSTIELVEERVARALTLVATSHPVPMLDTDDLPNADMEPPTDAESSTAADFPYAFRATPMDSPIQLLGHAASPTGTALGDVATGEAQEEQRQERRVRTVVTRPSPPPKPGES